MKTLEELETYIKNYRSKRMKQKAQMLKTDITVLNRLFCEALDELIGRQIDNQLHGQQKEIRYIYLCRLASSRYTESYKVLLGMSDSMLYLDDNKVEVLWYPKPIYENLKMDIDKIRYILEEQGKQIENKYLLEWKLRLMEDDWNLLKEQFPNLIQENFYRFRVNSLSIEKRFSALCGDYMERLPVVWETETE